jgi:hypothetical protein
MDRPKNYYVSLADFLWFIKKKVYKMATALPFAGRAVNKGFESRQLNNYLKTDIAGGDACTSEARAREACATEN